MTLDVINGEWLRGPLVLSTDVVVVGSGPAGAAVARTAAGAGARVVVVEEGACVRPADSPEDGFRALARLYRGLGATVTRGRAPMPVVQGCAVGGTSVVNGAISWRLPRDVYDEWMAADPGLALDWQELEDVFAAIEDDLNIAPTPDDIAGRKNLLMARGADALGLEHRPIHRNVRGCRGLGRCLQGCPEGNKLSMDQSYLPDAVARGARIVSRARVERVEVARGRAVGVTARAAGGGRVRVDAARAVVLAASAVQTPTLLAASGIGDGPVGDGFQCHPGVSVCGRFPEQVKMWTGATQGHEVTGLRGEGIKLEVLGFDMGLAAARLCGVGRALTRAIEEDLPRVAMWGAAIRAGARGRVRRGRVRFDLLPDDVRKVRRGVRVLGELLLAAGADTVYPGVLGWPEAVTDPTELARLEATGPDDPRAYSLVVTHMMSTCRMGRDGVVRPDFRHHRVDGLYVADSSVFPSNTGVNPQTTILALATLCGRRIVA